MRRHTFRHIAAGLSLTCIALLGPVGCGGGGNDEFDPNNPNLQNAFLEHVGPDTLFLNYGANATIGARYMFQDRSPIQGAPLQFAIDGDPQGARLDAVSSVTGADGVASVPLRAGVTPATFRVRVSPPEGSPGAPIFFNITVSEDAAGSIVVNMTYAGEQRFTNFRPYLWNDRTCNNIDPRDLPLPAFRIGDAVSRIADRPRFDNLEPGRNYAVVVLAEVSSSVEGWGCVGTVEVRDREETRVDMTIEDVITNLLWPGTYELDSDLNFNDVLPESVGNVVDIFDEMTDDTEEEFCGSDGAQGYGDDPGAFIVDWVMRQTCAWECTSGDYDSCEPGHPTGDVQALCDETFNTWSGCEARFWGGCGMWEFIFEPVQDFVNEQVDNVMPDFVMNVLNMAGDVSRAINRARIISELTLEEPTELGARFAHELISMEVRLRDWDAEWHEFSFDLVEAGFDSLIAHETAEIRGATLNIPEHPFELDYGELVRFIYVHGMLRAILGYDDTGDLLASLVDCVQVAAFASDQCDALVSPCPIDEDAFEDACLNGLDAAGEAIERQIASSVPGESHLTLAGACMADEVDPDGTVQTLDGDDGNVDETSELGWVGTWGEGTDEGNVVGEFTGERLPR